MNDIEYLLKQDAMDKKRSGIGAFHMKSGSKSHRCTLPQDHMTPAQLRKQNGDIMTYKMDEPCTLSQFDSWPEDIQEEYLSRLSELYHASYADLGRMWGVSDMTARRHTEHTSFHSPRGGHRPEEHHEMWNAFCNGIVGGKPEEPERTPTEVIEQFKNDFEAGMDSLPELDGPYDPDTMPRSTITMEPRPDELPLINHFLTEVIGNFDRDELAEWVRNLPVPEGRVQIRFEVTPI